MSPESKGILPSPIKLRVWYSDYLTQIGWITLLHILGLNHQLKLSFWLNWFLDMISHTDADPGDFFLKFMA